MEYEINKTDTTQHKNKLHDKQKKGVADKRAYQKNKNAKEESFGQSSFKTCFETAKKVEQSQGKRKPKSQRKVAETDAGKTLVVSGFPEGISSNQIYEQCSKYVGIENITYPVKGREKKTAYLLFKTHREAREALPHLDQKIVSGNVTTAVLLSKEGKTPSKKTLLKSKVIVRNLSFKCTESILKESFSSFGKVIEATIPIRKEGKRNKKFGFGFVQFTNVFDAAKAVEKMNLKEILGRSVAVDFTVPKDQYEILLNKQGKFFLFKCI